HANPASLKELQKTLTLQDDVAKAHQASALDSVYHRIAKKAIKKAAKTNATEVSFVPQTDDNSSSDDSDDKDNQIRELKQQLEEMKVKAAKVNNVKYHASSSSSSNQRQSRSKEQSSNRPPTPFNRSQSGDRDTTPNFHKNSYKFMDKMNSFMDHFTGKNK